LFQAFLNNNMIVLGCQKGKGKDVWGKGCGKDAWGKDAWGKDGGKDFGKGAFGPAGMKGAFGKGDFGKDHDPYWDNWVPGKYYEEPGGKTGIEGLKDAITRAVAPHGAESMIDKICVAIFKLATKWFKDETRHKEVGTAIQAQALLEEFAEAIMAALNTALHDKAWFHEIYLSEGVALAAINTFKGGQLFKRTVAPIIVTHIDEAIFRYREAERHQRVMWDAIASVGFKSDYHKKANKHLTTSFEASYVAAKYGTSPSISQSLGMIQDFLNAWIRDFAKRAWDCLANGINSPTQDQQIGVVVTLFQYLCDPAHTCLPIDLLQQVPAEQRPPPAWDFVQQAVIETFQESM